MMIRSDMPKMKGKMLRKMASRSSKTHQIDVGDKAIVNGIEYLITAIDSSDRDPVYILLSRLDRE